MTLVTITRILGMVAKWFLKIEEWENKCKSKNIQTNFIETDMHSERITIMFKRSVI